MLRDGVEEFWGPDTVPFERTGLPLRQRMMGWLVGAGPARASSRSSWRSSTGTAERAARAAWSATTRSWTTRQRPAGPAGGAAQALTGRRARDQARLGEEVVGDVLGLLPVDGDLGR